MEALLLVPFEVHSLLLGAAVCCWIPWVKALPSHLGKGEITSCNRAVSSQKMQGSWAVAADCLYRLLKVETFKIHFTNITHDNLWCHLTDVSHERSLTNNNILLILRTILTTFSHPLTHTHLSRYGLKLLADSNLAFASTPFSVCIS